MARQLAIFRALVRPDHWMGCERMPLIGLVGIVAIYVGPVGFAKGRYWAIALGAVLFSVGVWALREWAKREPAGMALYFRSKRYRGGYVANARVDVRAEGRG